jgi:meckelin
LEDFNEDLIDVPVLIKNFKDNNGILKNADASSGNEGTWRLVRRFFLADTKSGISGADGYVKGDIPMIMRYAKSITLRIKLDTKNEEMIYTPLLIINYRERTMENIKQDPLASVSFRSEYQMDSDSATSGIRITFIVFMAIFGAMVVVQVAIWSKIPQLSDDPLAKCQYTIVKIILALVTNFSQLFFWFLVIISGYWFIFFKWQEQVYILLPEVNHYSTLYYSFDVIFGLVLSTKLVMLLYKIYFEQCSNDIFLVDWERPKTDKLKMGGESSFSQGVNAWRSLLLINELNELQCYKVISTEFTLLAYAFFMDGIGFRYFSSQNPYFDNKPHKSPENYVLNFFITAIVMYVIGIAQYLFRYLIKIWFPLPYEEFTDLCSISNISVLMFDSEYKGYYIHGRSPYGQSEVTSSELAKSIEFEITGQAQMRGLVPDDPNLQTFEIFMPKVLLSTYKDQYYREINQEISKQLNDKIGRYNSVQQLLTRERALPEKFNVEKLEEPGNFMNRNL